MIKFKMILTAMCLLSVSAFAQYDDIYFNPKTDIPKQDVRYVVKQSNAKVQEKQVMLDDDANLTEETYTYTQRLNAFHNENLLVHIEGNDTTIYDLANGKYQIDVDGKNLDISGVDDYYNSNYNVNPYYSNSMNNFAWGWNPWMGMSFYYTSYYSPFGWNPWNPYFYNSWYSPYYCYGCYQPYYPYYPSHGGNTYSDRSNETYLRQHNSEGRYSNSRSAATTSGVGSRNSGASSNSNVNRSSTTRSSDPTVTNAGTRSSSTGTSTRSGSTVRVQTSPSSSGNRSTGTSSSPNSSTSTNRGTRYTGTSSGSSTTTSSRSSSGTRSSGTSSGGSRGGGSSSGGGGSRSGDTRR